ncbi:MAG TPA: ECF-type sigma factor [Dokdonella sp.]|uniref:ECF-type sigma factor n=1 Tax=Dokdonella sp. TaxID=2291710 RepID=UPI002B91BF5A|nr:ECF-type sigma factor [Dokdonella sp.]HOX70118.1 ECF-type sigma factor [Dokdonella sp.]HPG93894.1 ECF-type sigma factor [Dokdonella sp.]HPN78296.1 ECF-type sigma factor [Dokdonella sp.]
MFDFVHHSPFSGGLLLGCGCFQTKNDDWREVATRGGGLRGSKGGCAMSNDADPSAEPIGEMPSQYAGDKLFVEVYERLKKMAGNQLLDNVDSINATGLVHELYMRMIHGKSLTFVEPAQFFDYAAKAMRHLLVDRARGRMRTKRGGGLQKVDLPTETTSLADATAQRALELDDGLRKLEIEAPRAARIVELHYFAGLSLPQVATQLAISTRTVNREWRFARALLNGEPVDEGRE